MTRLRGIGARTFRALRVRNFRLYFIGQVISLSGTWMQTVALALLILARPLHGNGVDVGAATALQYLPILLFGTLGGVLADRVDKRRLLVITQSLGALQALVLAILTITGAERMWEVFVLSGALGVVTLFTNPTRQAFVSEMVGRELLPNAVSLNSVLINAARVLGPALGAVIIFTAGFAACFFFNAASFVAVIVALVMMRRQDLLPARRVERARGQVRAALRYVWRTPPLRRPLLGVALIGTLAFNFTTTLPLLAKYTFGGGTGTYSLFTVCMGGGAIVGGLFVAHRSRPSVTLLGRVGLLFGVFMVAVALSPSQTAAMIALVPMGLFSIAFLSTANATVQLAVDPSMRGRVMSLYAICMIGSAPIGAPLMGWLSDVSSPRLAMCVGAAAALAGSFPLARVSQLGAGRRARASAQDVAVASAGERGRAEPPATGAAAS